MFRESDIHIGKLKVRVDRDRRDRSALLNRLSFLLDTVDFKPPGIPPSGVLLVRSLEDPLPGKIMTDKDAILANRDWQRAAREVLIEKYRRASRPVKGYIPPDAEAVFFSDEGQMLAALLLDINSGQALSRWWWQVILQKMNASPEVEAILCKEITLVPAVMFHLSEWQAAERVVAGLSLDQAKTVLNTLSREFGLSGILNPIYQQKEVTAYKVPSRDVKAPWEQWLPAHRVPAALAGEKAALLGISLSLLHAPEKLRTTSFIKEFSAFWQHRVGMPGSMTRQDDIPGRGESSHDPGGKPYRAETGGAEQLKKGEKQPGLDRGGASVEDKAEAEAGQKPASSPSAAPPPLRQISGSSGDASANKEKEKIGTRIRFGSSPAEPGDAQTASAGMIEPSKKEKIGVTGPEESPTLRDKEHFKILGEEGVVTRLGGLFYLINLMNDLDLPGCFEEQCGLAAQVGAWGVLELLSRSLAAEIEVLEEPDPLWPVLAELAGREPGTLPGDDFCCKKEIRLPQEWLQKLPIPEPGYQTNSGIMDSVRKQVKSNPLLQGLNPHLMRWLETVLPYITRYIEFLLKSAAKDKIDPVINVLTYPARVYVTATHVDVVMKLADISLPARSAGLDRDPGWMPDFGRIILFHYE